MLRPMGANTKVVAAGVVVVALGAGGGWWAWSAAKSKAEREALVKLVGDTTGQLRQALEQPPSAEVVASLEAIAGQVKGPRHRELADAAEHYAVGAREIARRRADAMRLAAESAAARQALAAHMAHRARGAGWYQQAVSLKNKVEQLHGDLGRSLKALEELLLTMPETEKRLAPHVGQALLLDAGVREAARKRAQDETVRASAELERARALIPR